MGFDPGWKDLSGRLVDTFVALPVGAMIRVFDRRRTHEGYRLEVWRTEDRITLLLTRSASVEPHLRLGEHLDDLLVGAGFREADEAHRDYWWSEALWPPAAEELARLADRVVVVLKDYLYQDGPQRYAYTAWTVGADSVTLLDLPELGLDRQVVTFFAHVGPFNDPDRPKNLVRRTVTGDEVRVESYRVAEGFWLDSDLMWRSAEGILAREQEGLVEIDEARAHAVRQRWDEERRMAERDERLRQARERWLAGQPPGTVLPQVALPTSYRGRTPLPDEVREPVVRYLRDAPLVLLGYGFERDELDPQGAETVPLGMHTDGFFVWSSALAYYAERYGIAPDTFLLGHLAERDYVLPEVDHETLMRVTSFLKVRA